MLILSSMAYDLYKLKKYCRSLIAISGLFILPFYIFPNIS